MARLSEAYGRRDCILVRQDRVMASFARSGRRHHHGTRRIELTRRQIMLASYHGHVNLVQLLLQHNADPNRLNDRGQSPLAGVVFKHERECIEALLAGGADPEVGEPSALDACKIFKQEEFESMFNKQVERLRGTGSRAVNGGS